MAQSAGRDSKHKDGERQSREHQQGVSPVLLVQSSAQDGADEDGKKAKGDNPEQPHATASTAPRQHGTHDERGDWHEKCNGCLGDVESCLDKQVRELDRREDRNR